MTSNDPVRIGLWGAALAAALLGPPAWAIHSHFILHDETLCDADRRLCIHGNLLHHDISNTLRLSARIKRSAEPGLVTLRLVGTTPAGLPAIAEFRFRVEGRYSEIIDQKMIADFPSQTRWSLSGMFFEPGEAPER